LNYNWNFAHAKEFLVALDELDIDKLKTTPKKAIEFYGVNTLGWYIFWFRKTD